MRKKLTYMICCAFLLSGALIGCGHETNDTNITTTEEKSETTEDTTAESSIEPASVENTSSFSTDKALENTYLCGVQLAPDMTWGMLGGDFAVEAEDTSYSEKNNELSCRLDYKGQYVGGISFKECKQFDDITEDSKIGYFLIRNDDIEKFDIQKITVCDIALNDSREALYSALGEPQMEYGDDKSTKYFDADDGRVFNFAFTDDMIQFIFISL